MAGAVPAGLGSLRRVLVVAATLVLAVPLSGAGLGHQVAAAAHTPHRSGWASLSGADQGVVSAAVGRDDAGYWVRPLAGIPALVNTAQHFTAQFLPTGAEVATGDAHWGLGLAAVGHGYDLHPVAAALPVPGVNRVDYRRGSVTEWYVNGPAGLEQGFTLAERPSGDPNQGLTLALGAPGSLTGVVDRGGVGLVLTHGRDSLVYRGLTASDATGRALPAHLDLHRGQVLVRVDDQGARYPVTVDPFVQTAKLIASDGATRNLLGAPVAISGNTVVAAAPIATVGGNTFQGAAYVFVAPTSPGGTLTQVAKLTASDGAATTIFGGSVAIDGNTIVVGAHNAKVGNKNSQGAVYVFVEPAGGWSGAQTETAKLIASDGGGGDQLGQAVAISGNTVVAGAYTAPVHGNTSQGAAYVFAAPWTGTVAAPQLETAKLASSDGVASDEFGDSAAISGNTIVIDAPQATVNGNIDAGAMYVFVAPWTGTVAAPQHQTAKLTVTDSGTVVRLGRSESLAVSGNTVVAGAHQAQIGTHQSQGAAYVFVQPAGGWAGPQTESAKLTASDGTDSDQLGNSVGISGNTVVAGAPGVKIDANFSQGAVYVFVAPLNGWAGPQTESAKLLAADGATGDQLGEAVAISGTTMVAGANAATVGGITNQGAAYVFQAAPAATTTTLGVTPSSPAPASPGETLTAIITPAGGGTVQFMDGTNSLGAPAVVTDGSASLTTSLAPGPHALSAVFTPTDQTPVTGYTGSTSATVSYTVNAKRPLCIRECR